MSKIKKDFYNKDYYYGDKVGQYHHLANGKNGEYNGDYTQRAVAIINAFKPKSVLDLGCGTGQLIDILRMGGVDARGIDLSEYAANNNEYIINGDVSTMGYPDTDVVVSFDLLEHLTIKQIDNVLDKCFKFDIIFHSISTGYGDYGDVTFLKNMDKSHISMYSMSWWMKKFQDKFMNSHIITVMTRKDYVDCGKYKFTNTNFLLTKNPITILQKL